MTIRAKTRPVQKRPEGWYLRAGWRFCDLLFARDGVALDSPGNFMDPFVAERSTLYWTYRRYARQTEDLSVGWGGNSQWRTAFRRDYEDAERFHFNVDGLFDVTSPATLAASVQRADREDPNDHLPLARRRELVMHRCFVASRRFAHQDVWSDQDTLSVRKEAPVWPWRDGQGA